MNDFNKEPEFGTEQPAPETPEVPETQPETVAAEPVEPAEQPAQPEFHAPAQEEPQMPVPPYAPYTQRVQAPPPYPVPPQYYSRVDGPTATFVVDLPKKKRRMPRALKALIITLCILFATTSVGLLGYGAYSFISNFIGLGDISFESEVTDEFEITPDEEENKDARPGKKPENGQKEESAADHEITIPDIDVTPNTEGLVLHATPTTEELDITEVYDKVIRSTVLVLVTAETGTGSGTGIMATEDGYIITNSHVVLNSRNVEVEIKMDDGSTHEAVVVGFDKTTDLAVLKIEGNGYTPAEFADSNDLRMGQWVLAIGNPGGEQFSGSITRGVISGLDRSVGTYSSNGMTYIQTDAAINPGNSGGPLVNLYGQVVGINSSKIVSDQYEGMGFAIPVTGAKKIIDDLLSGGYVQGRVRFGITGGEINAMQAYMSDVPQGFMITTIDEVSSFTGTDVQPYDIITAVDGEKTPSHDALSNVLLNYAPGDTVTVTIFRPNQDSTGGEEFEVEVQLLADLGETQN